MNDEPLGYFLTWVTYGTWLPGDERGWVEYQRGWKLPDPGIGSAGHHDRGCVSSSTNLSAARWKTRLQKHASIAVGICTPSTAGQITSMSWSRR